MRTGLGFLLSIVLSFSAEAQRRDSIVLAPVSVYALTEEKYLAGSMVHTVDSALRPSNESRHLGDLLALQLPVYFRTYGSGMLSGISMRGTSPQHTAVLWNGINITSFSLGQADFSILPVAALDEIKVHEGGGSARYGSGAFGGTVLLNSTRPAETSLAIHQEIGSFGRYFSSVNANVVTGRWSFGTRAYNLSSKNNFPILSTDVRQQHADFRQSGFLQSVSYQFSSARDFQLHYWFHDADRNIQPGISQTNVGDNQKDRNHRLSLRFQNRNRFGQTTAAAGYVQDQIDFNGSKSTIVRWITNARQEFVVAKSVHIQAGSEYNHIIGKIKEWNNGKAVEDRFDFTAAVQKDFGSRVSASINLRQPFVPGFRAPFLPYLGIDYAVMQLAASKIMIRGSASKNYRIPTLNDRYWQNAGDRTLLPETSIGGEAGASWRSKTIDVAATAFTQTVNEWIQWVPQENGNYRPRNIKQVRAQGIELSIVGRAKISSTIITAHLSYQLTSAVTERSGPTDAFTVGKQLTYTPTHIGTGSVAVKRKSWTGNISAQYSGRRFTESSNSDLYALQPYALLDISLSKQIFYRSSDFRIQCSAKNIFNQEYQMFAGRAMPGRSFNFSIIYQLKPKHNEF